MNRCIYCGAEVRTEPDHPTIAPYAGSGEHRLDYVCPDSPDGQHGLPEVPC